MSPLLLAAGYLNSDVTATVPRLPGFGERVTALSISRSFGGMTANAACAAARFGLGTEFFGRVGDDPEGDAALSELRRFGVGTRWVVRSSEPTTTALVLLGPDGERGIISEPMGFDYGPLEGALEAYSGEENACVHVDGYRIPEVAGLLRRARTLGFRTSADLDGIPAEDAEDRVEDVADALDCVVLNAGLAAALAPTLEATAERLLRLGAGVVGVTSGGEGALVAWSGGMSRLRAPRVEVRDATGAGDSFVGAFLAGWLGGDSVEDAARLAVAAGAISVGAPGARGRLPTRPEAGELARAVMVEREKVEEGSGAG